MQITVYEKSGSILIHLVNEIGQRPLLETIPVFGICMKIKLKEEQYVLNVSTAITGTGVSCTEKTV